MARQPALNEEALVKLGSEKLASMVIGEAKRNAAFRKLVAAALATTKGPAAVAAIIDKRLAGLDRAKAFVDWEKAKAFTADIAATLATITGELASADPEAAVDRLVRFLSTAGRVFERIDDSNGRLQNVYHEAAAALPDLVGRLEQADKASIPDRLFALTVSDDYGFFSTVMPELVAHLPAYAVDHWDELLAEMERSLGSIKDADRDWKKRAKADRIICLRQAIADCRQDVEAFIALEKSRPDGHHNTMAIAERLCDAGRHSEALEWVRKRGRPGLKVMTYDDLADGSSPRDVPDLARTRLEIRILEAMRDRTTAQDLRWKTFETTLDIGMLRDGLVTPIRACGLAGGQVARGMKKISYKGYRFPLEIIQQAIWLYVRFTLSFRDVEDLLAERGIMVSYETVRRWVNHFGPMIAANLRKRRPKPYTTWHLDEVYLKIDGRMVYLWRAVDAEGEVLDVLVQAKRNKRAALKLMRKLLKKYGFVPDKLVTDDLRSYAAAAGHLGIAKRHERGQWRNNRAENSHQPTRRRERKMQGFKSPGSAQKFLSTHAAAYNTFNVQRHLTSAKTHRAFRATAMQTWRDVVAAA